MDEEEYRREVQQNLRLDKETKEKFLFELNGGKKGTGAPSEKEDTLERPYLPDPSVRPAGSRRRPGWKRAAPYAGIAAALALTVSAALCLLPRGGYGLASEEAGVDGGQGKDVQVVYMDTGASVILPAEDAEFIYGLVQTEAWSPFVDAVARREKYCFDISEARLFYDCGAFWYYEQDGSSVYLSLGTEKERQVNAILERYFLEDLTTSAVVTTHSPTTSAATTITTATTTSPWELPTTAAPFPETTAPENLHATTTAPVPEQLPTLPPDHGSVEATYLDSGASALLKREDAAALLDLLRNGSWWQEEPVCLYDYRFEILGTVLQYHSDCGAVYNEISGRSVQLSEEERVWVNRLLDSVSWPSQPATVTTRR